MIKLVLVSLLLNLFSLPAKKEAGKGKLNVIVTGLENNDGLVGIRLYKNQDGFPTDGAKAFKQIFIMPEDNMAVIEVPDLEFGTYAIGAIHDENGNKKFDKNLIGFPKEGFGASNDPKAVLGPPPFKKSRFEFSQSGQSITFSINYF